MSSRNTGKQYSTKITVPRDIEEEWLTTTEILIITGIRRCGKSVLPPANAQQIAGARLLFQFWWWATGQLYCGRFPNIARMFLRTLWWAAYLLFWWDTPECEGLGRPFVRRLYNEGNKVIVTGSNARMLSRELGTHLTGRYIAVEIFPFSFQEYLQLAKVQLEAKDFYLTSKRAILLGHFKEYLEKGGFPKYLQSSSTRYLSSLYDSIIFRDVMARNGWPMIRRCRNSSFISPAMPRSALPIPSLGKIGGHSPFRKPSKTIWSTSSKPIWYSSPSEVFRHRCGVGRCWTRRRFTLSTMPSWVESDSMPPTIWRVKLERHRVHRAETPRIMISFSSCR